METKRILLVEDHHETNRMIRTAIESLGQKFTVVNVPSGEEAIIEMRLGKFDLVITDIVLPGISGVEFIEMVRTISRNAKVIVMTGDANSIPQKKLEELNVYGFFAKPLDMMALLNTARVALGLEGPKAPEAKDSGGSAASVTEDVRGSTGTSDRLAQLRRDLGALAVYLVDQDGYITTRAGDVTSLDLENVLGDIEVAFNAGLRASQKLGFGGSRNIQFFDGSDFGMYVINVGQFFMLVVIYDSERSAKQIGQVMLYGRRGADDLLNMMADIVADDIIPGMEAEEMIAPQTIAIPDEAKEVLGDVLGEALGTGTLKETGALKGTGILTPPPSMQLEPEPEPEPEDFIDLDLDVLFDAGESVEVAQADDIWGEPATLTEEEDSGSNSLSFEQAMKLGLFGEDDEE